MARVGSNNIVQGGVNDGDEHEVWQWQEYVGNKNDVQGGGNDVNQHNA